MFGSLLADLPADVGHTVRLEDEGKVRGAGRTGATAGGVGHAAALHDHVQHGLRIESIAGRPWRNVRQIVARVALVASGIGIAVGLRRVGISRAVVAGIAHAVAIAILLKRVGIGRAVVAGIAHAIAIAIRLGCVRGAHAVVADIAHAVAIAILLKRVGIGRAVVAGIAHTVAIRIRLGGVGCRSRSCRRHRPRHRHRHRSRSRSLGCCR